MLSSTMNDGSSPHCRPNDCPDRWTHQNVHFHNVYDNNNPAAVTGNSLPRKNKSARAKRSENMDYVINESGFINQVPMALKVQLQGRDPPPIRPQAQRSVYGPATAINANTNDVSDGASQIDPLIESLLQDYDLKRKQELAAYESKTESELAALWSDEAASKSAEAQVATLKDRLISIRREKQQMIGYDEGYTSSMYLKDLRPPSIDHAAKSKRSIGLKTHLDFDQAPVHDLNSIADIMVSKLETLKFGEVCKALSGRELRIVTMCSGTESPLLAMQMLNGALARKGYEKIKVNHLASAEIEPFKQAYIQRNFEPDVLFRDVTEFIDQDAMAHTAFGGLAEQPDEVHILIAGSSCIDYSSLNSKKKDFAQNGQSYNTMNGVFQYAKRYRPAIVILENVEGAPWDEVVNTMWSSGGYFCITFFLDSKDFYIPQTRNRGYMIGFDLIRAREVGLDCYQATATIVNALKCLSQRASSPYTDFIYDDDDPELKLARKELSRTMDSPNSMDWAKCRVRYDGFRKQHALGNVRPLTFWKNGGKCLFSDYAWNEWARGQRERIWDTLDINFLAYLAERHYDMRYKNRFIELSQNVDRDQDSRHWGIVGCITPSGAPWDSRRGGPVFGREALALQGIPVQNLSLNRESSRQLQNLAGNAMTTTVIGSVLFSALLGANVGNGQGSSAVPHKRIAMFEDFTSSAGSHEKSLEMVKHIHDSLFKLIENEDHRWLLQYEKLQTSSMTVAGNTQQLKDLATSTKALCTCDGIDLAPRQLQQCRLCGHTACTRCSGNPPHKYIELRDHDIEQRKKPESFIDSVSEVLPRVMNLNLAYGSRERVVKVLLGARHLDDHVHEADKKHPEHLNTIDEHKYHSAVLTALNCTVFFQSVKQGSLQRAIYESSAARVELHFSQVGQPGQNRTICTWFVFAQPPAHEPAVSVVRDLLQYPVARMQPSDHDILEGVWEIWDPSVPYASLDIYGFGKPQPAWEQRLGLQQDLFRSLEVFPKLKFSPSMKDNKHLTTHAIQILNSISGTYDLLADYGSACASLHKRSGYCSGEDQAAYFFLEPKPLQDAFLDRMVFADAHVRLPHGVNRQVKAELIKAWRPNTSSLSDEAGVATKLLCRLTGIWLRGIEIILSPNEVLQDLVSWVPRTMLFDLQVCEAVMPLLITELPVDILPQYEWDNIGQRRIALIDQPGAMKDFQWHLKPLSQHFSNNPKGGIIHLEDHLYSCCITCTPKPPPLMWQHTRRYKKEKKTIEAEDERVERKENKKPAQKKKVDGKSAKKKSLKKVTEDEDKKEKIDIVIRPFEDTEAATAYEKQLAKRPVPIEGQVVTRADHTVWLVVKLNLTTVVHRIRNKLALEEPDHVKWQLVRYTNPESTPVFPRIILANNDSTQEWPKGGDKAYEVSEVFDCPRRFARNLWESQRRALQWMLGVELGTNWEEWDAEIHNAPALDLQLQVEGFKKRKVKGGIIADEVGAGKTTTSLALVARGLEYPYDPLKPHTHRIPSRATLILVPNNIIEQWYHEIIVCFKQDIDCASDSKKKPKDKRKRNSKEKLKDKLNDAQDQVGMNTERKKLKVVKLDIKSSENSQTIKELENADIILAPWQLFSREGDDNYWAALSELCGAPNMPKSGGRAFDQWLDDVIDDIAEIIQICGHDFELDLKYFNLYRAGRAEDKMHKYTSYGAFSAKAEGDQHNIGGADAIRTGVLTPAAIATAADKEVKDRPQPTVNRKRKEGLRQSEAELASIKAQAQDIAKDFKSWYKHGEPKRRIPALLHFFSFNRLIVDEFTYLDARALSAVQHLEARYRWLLSGTPPITNAESIESMARLIGTRVSPHTNADTVFSFKDARTVKADEKSYAEDFRDRLQVRAPEWHKRRNERCSDFVGTFIRQNRAPKDDLSYMVHYEIVSPSVLELHLYNKCFQRIANDFLRFGVNSQIKATDSTETIVFKTLQQAMSPEEALLSCHANLITHYVTGPRGNDDEICRQLVAEAHSMVVQNFAEIVTSLREAYYYWTEGQAGEDNSETNEHLVTYLHGILTRSFGDPCACDLLSSAAAFARVNVQKPALRVGLSKPVVYDEEIKHNIKIRRSELQKRATVLNTASLKLVEQLRQLRHCKAMGDLLGGHDTQQPDEDSQGVNPTVIDCNVCQISYSIEVITLLGCCGHFVCPNCLERAKEYSWDRDTCPVKDCSATSNHCQILASTYANTETRSTSRFGTKLDKVIEEIQSIDDGERVLVFIQFSAHREQLLQALRHYHIRFTDGTRGGAPSIRNFQLPENRSKVLVLQIDSPDAAGWNLQIANHVMFITPFLAKTQYDYESTMTQAIGRALRHGQQRLVKIYHFITAMTLDVNVLQDRTGKKLVKRTQGAGLVGHDDPAAAGPSLAGPSLDFDAIKKAGEGEHMNGSGGLEDAA